MPKHPDTVRLDWLTRKRFVLYHVGGAIWRVGVPIDWPYVFKKSPRQAIDAAMKAERGKDG